MSDLCFIGHGDSTARTYRTLSHLNYPDLSLLYLDEFYGRSDECRLFFAHFAQTAASFCHAPEASEVCWQRLGIYKVGYFLDDVLNVLRIFYSAFYFSKISHLHSASGPIEI